MSDRSVSPNTPQSGDRAESPDHRQAAVPTAAEVIRSVAQWNGAGFNPISPGAAAEVLADAGLLKSAVEQSVIDAAVAWWYTPDELNDPWEIDAGTVVPGTADLLFRAIKRWMETNPEAAERLLAAADAARRDALNAERGLT